MNRSGRRRSGAAPPRGGYPREGGNTRSVTRSRARGAATMKRPSRRCTPKRGAARETPLTRYRNREGTARNPGYLQPSRNTPIMRVCRCHKRPFLSPSWNGLTGSLRTRPNPARVCRHARDLEYVQDGKTRRGNPGNTPFIAPPKHPSRRTHPSPRTHPHQHPPKHPTPSPTTHPLNASPTTHPPNPTTSADTTNTTNTRGGARCHART